MRLLIVSQYFWPENFRINDLVSGLIERGHEVTVLTGVPNYPEGHVFPEYRQDIRRFRSYAGAAIVRVPLLPRGRSRISLALNYLTFALSAPVIGSWKLRGRKFDAIFAYEPSPVTVGIPAVFLRALKRAPLVFWVLDLWPETLEAMGVLRSRGVLRVVGTLVGAIYNRCDLILAQSRSFIPQIARRCKDPSRIAYFPSWAEAVFSNASDAPTPEVPAMDNSFDVMFAGNIGEAQDFPSVLAAAEILKTHAMIRWLIVGDGRMAQWVREEISRRNLEHCVLMLGKHPLEKMPGFYRRAHALLICLKDEPVFSMTIPGKLQTYLSAGIPIIAMLNGEGADVIKRSCSGLTCRAGDAQTLAARVLDLASLSKDERARMGRNALTASATEFNRGKLIAQLEVWLEELITRSRVGAVT
jgi:glycosyltransferase involved in cell wall biosynthesis